METNLIRSLISSYFGIVRQTIQDQVPKAVMHVRSHTFYFRPPCSCLVRLTDDRSIPSLLRSFSCSSTSRASRSSLGW
jgi:replication fork clamp-binding protein CrfC